MSSASCRGTALSSRAAISSARSSVPVRFRLPSLIASCSAMTAGSGMFEDEAAVRLRLAHVEVSLVGRAPEAPKVALEPVGVDGVEAVLRRAPDPEAPVRRRVREVVVLVRGRHPDRLPGIGALALGVGEAVRVHLGREPHLERVRVRPSWPRPSRPSPRTSSPAGSRSPAPCRPGRSRVPARSPPTGRPRRSISASRSCPR